ncbi:MAG: hypothetical protein NUW14_04185 [Deltaproteobacteria bacterium]|nr:hypothetical protein [Deltaproteobacteria bacterium]
MNSLRRLLRNVPVLRFGEASTRRWAELREKGARTASKYGVKSESDVDRILHELREVLLCAR